MVAPVWERPAADTPQTHALIIGVGAYAHLRKGTGPRAAIDLGLRQLTSPPISGRAVADWLLTKLNPPDAPLGSVDLLLSEAVARTYVLPGGDAVAVQPATMANIEAAVKAWYRRCHAHPENVALFYFCGHGVLVRGDRLLLAADFGADDLEPFANAINFDKLYLGMTRCQAGIQCYFVDACRQIPYEGGNFAGEPGRAIISPPARDLLPRDDLILSAATPDDSAYATSDRISRFTEALLLGLNGLSCDPRRPQGKWRITTTTLGPSIRPLVNHLNRLQAGPIQQSTPGGEPKGERAIHILTEPPIIPVALAFEPTEAERDADLDLVSTAQQAWHHVRTPGKETWQPEAIRASVYRLAARYKPGTYKDFDKEVWIFPPVFEESCPVERAE